MPSEGPPARRPTLGSVAARAGVSKQTVSNVLNSPHLVRDETLDRVRAAITALGYRPHRAAQQLRTRRSRVIALRVEREGDTVFDRFLHALTDAASAREYRVMLYTAADDDAEIAAYDHLLDHWDIDGLVLTTTHPGDPRMAWLAGAGIPFVSFGRPWYAVEHHPWVDVDGAAATADATRLLLDQGRRTVGFLGWPEGSGVGDDRLSGWRQALTQAGREVPEPARATNDIVDARRAAAALLDRARPDAIVCCSDLLALGALAEIAERGLRPGTDVAVVGFDNSDLAQATGLTSVAQPLAEAAARIVELLVAAIEQSETGPDQILLRASLAQRSSTQT